jgi:hypothetical protein
MGQIYQPLKSSLVNRHTYTLSVPQRFRHVHLRSAEAAKTLPHRHLVSIPQISRHVRCVSAFLPAYLLLGPEHSKRRAGLMAGSSSAVLHVRHYRTTGSRGFLDSAARQARPYSASLTYSRSSSILTSRRRYYLRDFADCPGCAAAAQLGNRAPRSS